MINKQLFIEQLKNAITVGSVLENPGGGISTIAGIGSDKLSYIRGSSKMYLPYDEAFDALEKFSGKVMTSYDLKQINPSVFDSTRGGHSCNCTVLFCLLAKMGLLDGGINGSGHRGNPFYVKVIDNP